MRIDIKKFGKIRGIGHRITGNRRGSGHGLGWEYLHVCVDDATRLAYAEVLPDEKGATARTSTTSRRSDSEEWIPR